MDNLKTLFQAKCVQILGKKYTDCNHQEQFKILSLCIMDHISERWMESREKSSYGKQAYYFSSEYLIGRMLNNNLMNLEIDNTVKDFLSELNIDYKNIEQAEEDAGLGNGGLGRLAACFLDSAATLNLPLQGYGLKYEYGIFKQEIENGFQIEKPDEWSFYGYSWGVERMDERVLVRFADMEVLAIPYDIPIIGYHSNKINTLRLWSCRSPYPLNLDAFNQQNYIRSVKEKNSAENITKILYPNDSKLAGKILRIRQQYLLSSASLQDMMQKHKNLGRHPEDFHKYHVIQLNDTHPAVSIAELMRLLTETEHISWERAWRIVQQTFAYTNHTILEEALEKWPTKLYQKILPDIYRIIKKIDQQWRWYLKEKGIPKGEQNKYQIIESRQIHMARLSIYSCFSINGVAHLHTKILKERELKHFYKLFPTKFNNKTNGITPRRWLLESNPELSELITDLLGSPKWILDLSLLKKLEPFCNDNSVLNQFLDIKQIKKNQLARYIEQQEGIVVDTQSIFDIQIKRLHEYKRQLLNALYILDLYYRLKDNPNLDVLPRTFIFGAKAAPGYDRAKGIIKYIHEIQKMINTDKSIRNKIKVIFIKNYGVSNAQILFPAADISEQISSAGKEASGTGNMKFMLNGTPTLGTYDGANIEIVEHAGSENNFIFGLKTEDIEKIEHHYNPTTYYSEVNGLKRVLDTLCDGTFDDGGTGIFHELYQSILEGASWHRPDHYYLMADFESYREAQKKVDCAYRDPLRWAKKCWINLSNSGNFSSDRTILEYNRDIWKI